MLATRLPTWLRWRCLLLVSIGLLACNDARAVTPAPAGAVRSGEWLAMSTRDPITDQWRGVVRAQSTSKQAELFIRCTPDRVEGHVEWDLYIDWGQHLASSSTVVVWARFGTEPAFDASWELSTNEETTFAPVAFVIGERGLITRLQQTDRFLARVLRADETTVTAAWQTMGLTDVLRTLVAWCQQEVAA